MIFLILATTFSIGDWQLSQDKVAHFSMGFTVGSLVYAEQVWENEEDWQRRVAVSMLVVATVAFAKEDWDLNKGGGEASLADFAYTVVGGIVGNYICNWLVNWGNDKIEWKEVDL